MEILRTTRGGIKLSFEGFTYVKKNASSLAIRWACSNKNAFHCNGKLRTTLAMENPQVIHQHSHPAVEAPPSHGDSCLSIEVRRRGRPREQNSFVDASWRERNRSCEHDSYMACTGRARVGPKRDSLMAYEGKDDEPTTEREGKEDSVLKKGPTISQRSDKKKMNDTTPSVAGASAHEETAVFTKDLIPRGDGLRRDITDMTSSRIILCAQKKLAESAPGVRQQGSGQGLKGENPEVTPSCFIMNARKKVDEPAPGVSQLDDSPGLKGEIVHTTPSSYILGPQEKYAEPAPGVKQPGQLFRRETVDMTTSFLSTSHKHFDKPLAEAVELDITARSGIGSEKIDITPSATQKFGGLGDKVMTPQATPRRDIKRCYISTDQNRNFTVTTVSSSISTVRKTFTGPADGVGLSLETPKGELRKEMTDMTPSIFISPATKEAAKSAPEVMETQGTSRDELRNEKVDMMPSIYILNAQKKAAETIDLSETSSISDKEEEEIYLPMGHEGSNLFQVTAAPRPIGRTRKHDSLKAAAPRPVDRPLKLDSLVAAAPRPRGRPRKHDSLEAAAPRPVGRTRKHDSLKAAAPRLVGRPLKHDSLEAAAPRPRGRPCKHDSLEVASPRPVGRPRKHDILETAAPRPIGRPHKHDSLEAAAPRPRFRPRKDDSLKAAAPRPVDRPLKLDSLVAAAPRPRGRPCKHDSLKAVAPRPVGRPRKHDSLVAAAPRPRGRPRKHDCLEAAAPRTIGRPHKHDSLEAVAPRPRGRPRKHDSLEAAAPRPVERPCKHDSLEAVAPRPRGRPHNNDSFEAVAPRPRDRPCKHDIHQAAPPRPRGRPRRHDSCMAVESDRPCDHDSLLLHIAAAGGARSRLCEYDSFMTLDDEDDGVEDGYRADILAEEVSRSDGQFRLWRNVGRASTMFDSPSVGRCSIEIPPAIVIVNTPNGVIISKSESGSNGEASVADMILNPARVDICRDEVKEYFHRKYVGTKHSEEFYCSKRIKGKKCFDYEPKTKRTKRNGHQCHEESVKRTLNYPPPSEAKTCLSKEHRGNKGPFEIGLQCEIVEKAEENVPLAKGFKILKPARVDICRDEVKKYLHRKFMRAKHSKEFFCPKRIKGKKYYEYEPKTKRRKRSGNQRLVYQEPVEQNPVYLSPSEAEAYLSSKPGRNKDPSQVDLPWKIVEKGKENVHRAKEFGILNISGSKDIGHFTKTVPKSHERLICKHTDPSEKIDKGLVRTSGKNGRKRRKVVSPEESSGTGEQGDGQGKAEVDGQMYIDEDWTKECLEDDYEFVEQKKDESLVVREHFVVKKEELVQNVVKEEVDEIMVNKEVQQLNVVKEEFDQTVVNKDLVEPNVFEQEVDQTVVNKALVEPNVVEQEVDQTVVNKDLVEPNVVEQEVDQTVVNDTVVNKEQSVVRMHKWVVNFLPDEGQFLLQEIDEEQIMKDETNDTIFSNKALVGQNVVKEEVDQAVVNKPDEDHFVEKGKDEKQFLEQMDGEQFVLEKDKGQFKYEEQEQNVIREESENVIVVDSEVGEANMDKVKKEQYVVHREEDFVVVLNN